MHVMRSKLECKALAKQRNMFLETFAAGACFANISQFCQKREALFPEANHIASPKQATATSRIRWSIWKYAVSKRRTGRTHFLKSNWVEYFILNSFKMRSFRRPLRWKWDRFWIKVFSKFFPDILKLINAIKCFLHRHAKKISPITFALLLS